MRINIPAQFFPLTYRSSFMNKLVSIAAIVALTSAFSFSQEQEYNSPQEQEYIPPQEQEYSSPQEQEYIPPQEQEYSSPQEQEYIPPQEYKYNPPQKQKNEKDNSSTGLGGVRGAISFSTQALQLDEASGNSFGMGFVVGGIKPLSIIEDILFFSPGFDLAYINVCDECTLNTDIGPVKFESVYEFTLGVPLLIQLQIIKLYIEGGVQFNLPLYQYSIYDSDYGALEKVDINRETFDFGYVAGLGWKFDEKGAIGVRGFYSITGKYGEKENPKKLIQGGLSLTMFM